MSYSIPLNVKLSIEQQKDFVDHMDSLLSEVLVSTRRKKDLFFSDTDEILQLIEIGSVDDDN